MIYRMHRGMLAYSTSVGFNVGFTNCDTEGVGCPFLSVEMTRFLHLVCYAVILTIYTKVCICVCQKHNVAVGRVPLWFVFFSCLCLVSALSIFHL